MNRLKYDLTNVKKYAALLLCFVLLIQAATSFSIKVTGAEPPEPTLLYYGVPLWDGQELPEDAWIMARYEFGIQGNELNDMSLALPLYLQAAYEGSFAVTAWDVYGNEQNIGEAVVSGDGNILFDTSLTQSEADNFAPTEETVSGDAFTISYADESEETNEDTYENPDEEVIIEMNEEALWVAFEIPCVFDMEQVPEAEDDLPRQVSLRSGGETVTVNLVQGELAEMMPAVMMIDNFAAGDTFWDVARILNAHLYIGATELETGATVSYDDALVLKYKFEIDEATSNMIAQLIKTGSAKYELPVPDGLKWKLNFGVSDLTIDLGGGGSEKFAEIEVVNGVAYITFTGSFWNDPCVIEEGWLEMACGLDKDVITPAMSIFDLELAMNWSVLIFVKENEEDEYQISKTGGFMDNRLNWTVVYTPGQTEQEFPLSLVDTFDNTKHIYVPGSVTINGVQVDDLAVNISTVGTTTTIKYTIEQAAGSTPVAFSYQTRLSDTETASTSDTVADNKVYLKDKNEVNVAPPATKSVTVGAGNKRWMIKTGTQNGRDIEWTVNINTLDRDLRELVLYDALPAGLTLKEGSILVNGQPLTDTAVGASVVDSTGVVNGGYSASFAIKFDSVPYPQAYTVTYTTTVAESYFDNPNLAASFNNNAWLSFDWRVYNPDGTNGTTYVSHVLPTVGTDYNAVTNILRKYAMGYNPSTHIITWRVEVNPYNVDIVEGKITDELYKYGQTYAGGFTPGDSSITSTTAIGEDTLTVNVLGLGDKTSWFTFDALVDDENDYATNHNGVPYDNVANFSGKVNVEGVEVSVTDTASAYIMVTSTMLTKQGAGYTYNTAGEIEVMWSLIVNKNKMPLTNANVIDTLPTGLSYITGSAYIDSVQATGVVDAGQTLTIPLGATTNDTVTVTYRTKVDPNNSALVASFMKNNVVTVKNSAVLTREGYSSLVEAEGTQEIANQVLEKSGDFNKDDKVIKYTVNINPNGVMLNGQVIGDTLPEGLRLDITSVKLYTATMNPDKSFYNEGNTYYSYDNSAFNYLNLASDNSFTLTLPDGCGRYILEYDCYIVKGVDFDNKITFVTSGVAGDPAKSIESIGVGGGGGGTSNRKARLTITKTDFERPGVKLDGVKFSVYQRVGGNLIPVMDVVTGEDGIADLYPITPNTDYVIREIYIPGYSGISAASTADVTVSAVNALNGEITVSLSKTGEYTLNVTNMPAKGSFSFKKVSDKDEQGVFELWTDTSDPAEFTIYDQTRGSHYTATATSDMNGKVSFTNVPFGTYTVSETKAPDYHSKATDFEVTINANGVTVTGGGFVDGSAIVKNVYYRPNLSIKKVLNGGLASLEGIRFELYKVDGTSLIDVGNTAATNTSGNLTFNEPLYGGDSYVVKEISTLDKYYTSGEYKNINVNTPNDITVTWNNYAYEASIEVIKVDSMRKGVKLAGAVFELYSDSSGAPGALLATSGATGSDGVVKFTGLKLNQGTSTAIDPVLTETHYWIKEKIAPSGYTLNATPIPIVFEDNSAYNEIITKTVENTPTNYVSTSLTFYKLSTKNNANTPLANVTFKLTDKTPGSTLVFTATSGADGKVEFTNIPFGTYELDETAAPLYHKKMATVTVIFDSSGSCVKFNGKNNPTTKDDFTIYNEIFTPKLSIKKINADNTSVVLEGVWFDLYNLSISATVAEASKQTNSSGIVEFDLLGGDSYVIKERSAPAGYYVSADYSTGVITAASLPQVTWKNYPYAASIQVTKRDAVRTGVLLDGAVFNLYREENGGKSFVGAATSVNGVLTFSKLSLIQTQPSGLNSEPTVASTTYWLEEQQAPTGYVLNATQIPITLTSRKQAFTTNFDNEPVRGNLTFTKISRSTDNPDTPLEGATFKLTDLTSGSSYTASATSGSDGVVSFTGIPFGRYRVQETVVPAYHSAYPDFFVTIDKNGICTEFEDRTSFTNITVVNIQNLTNIEIIKKDDTGNPVQDVEFTLYHKSGGEWHYIDGPAYTDENGKVTFYNLVVHDTYKISETTPDDYYAPPDYEFVVLQTGHSFTWVNSPLKGKITITKKDTLTAAELAGVRFGLYDGQTMVAEAVTDENGVAVFDKLGLSYTYVMDNDRYEIASISSKTYIVKELEPLGGYKEDNTNYTFTLTQTEISKSEEITNDRIRRDIEFTKTNEWDFLLSGAEFTLTGDLGNSIIYTDTAVSDLNGVVKFDDVPYGEYTLTETLPPTNHKLDSASYAVRITENGTVVFPQEMSGGRFINDFDSGSIKINKIDAGTQRPIQGVTFTVFDHNGTQRGIAVTDASGIATFPKLMVNEVYTIKETPLPGYYQVEPLILTNVLVMDDERSITWNNYPCEGSVSITVVDSATGTPLRGVKFGIFAIDSTGNETLIAEATSGVNGMVVYNRLALNVVVNSTFDTPPVLNGTMNYVIRELNDIDGYSPVSSEIRVALSTSIPSTNQQVEKEKDPDPPSGDDDDDDDDDNGVNGGNGNGNGNGNGGSGNSGTGSNSGTRSNSSSSSNTTTRDENSSQQSTITQASGTSTGTRLIPALGAGIRVGSAADSDSDNNEGDVSEADNGLIYGESDYTNVGTSEADSSLNHGEGDYANTNGGLTDTIYTQRQGERGEVIDGVSVVIPELSEVPAESIIYPEQLPAGYSVVQISKDSYIIYDENGVPMGYLTLPDDMTLNQIDIMSKMIPIDSYNPKTGDLNGISNSFWLAVIALVLSAGAFLMIGRLRRVKK